MLPRRQIGEVRLPAVRGLLELLVRGEVRALVRRLAQRGERDPAVERAEALLAHDRVHGVARVAVAGRLERVRERVLLGLEPDLDDFHGRDDEDCFGYACAQAGCGGSVCWDMRGV